MANNNDLIKKVITWLNEKVLKLFFWTQITSEPSKQAAVPQSSQLLQEMSCATRSLAGGMFSRREDDMYRISASNWTVSGYRQPPFFFIIIIAILGEGEEVWVVIIFFFFPMTRPCPVISASWENVYEITETLNAGFFCQGSEGYLTLS